MGPFAVFPTTEESLKNALRRSFREKNAYGLNRKWSLIDFTNSLWESYFSSYIRKYICLVVKLIIMKCA